MTDEHLTRVALHGSINPDDVPSEVELTDKELEAIVEIIYVRNRREYGVYSRHRQTLYLDHGGGGPLSGFEEALEYAIETARSEGLPLLRRIYAWAPESQADELGADRIPIPWVDGDEDADG